MDRGLRQWALFLLVALALSCASGKKAGKAVVIATNRGALRECAFLAKLSQESTDNNSVGEGTLRQRTAELGGNTLLILPGGIGEAWDCPASYVWRGGREEPTRIPPMIFPTPPTTPRP